MVHAEAVQSEQVSSRQYVAPRDKWRYRARQRVLVTERAEAAPDI